MRFEWDEGKNRANQRKHGVSFDDASEVFGDPLHLSYELPEEYDFSGKEAVRGRFYSPRKKSITIRLDDDVVVYFRNSQGSRRWATSR